MGQIRTKSQMYGLLLSGAFGNTIRAWTYDEWLRESNKPSHAGFRYCSHKLHGPCLTGLYIGQLEIALESYEKAGWPKRDAIIGEELPNHRRIFQGEVCISERGYDLTYTTQALPMRPAMAQEQLYADGISALVLMRRFIDPQSLSEIVDLSAEHDNAVVEFTTCSIDVGMIPHRNTVIWEVRNY
jgi:hypothetical protein